jgi:hypothetical protein
MRRTGQRQGCLSGILQMAFLNFVFDFLQKRFGFGRGASCSGIGCGLILLLLFLIFACSIITNTSWTQFRF